MVQYTTRVIHCSVQACTTTQLMPGQGNYSLTAGLASCGMRAARAPAARAWPVRRGPFDVATVYSDARFSTLVAAKVISNASR